MKNTFKKTILGLALISSTLLIPKSNAQIRVGIGVPVFAEPVCPYGYFDYPPYACSPQGYYGPEWFGNGGIFIGAGPFYHGGRFGPGYHNGWSGGYKGGPGFHDGHYHGDIRSSDYRNHPEYHGGERTTGANHNGGSHASGSHGGGHGR